MFFLCYVSTSNLFFFLTLSSPVAEIFAFFTHFNWFWRDNLKFNILLWFIKFGGQNWLCSHHNGKLLRCHENHTGSQGFLSHTKTVISACDFWDGAKLRRTCLESGASHSVKIRVRTWRLRTCYPKICQPCFLYSYSL